MSATTDAGEAVGRNPKGNFHLRLKDPSTGRLLDHAEMLGDPRAGPLRRILESRAYRDTLDAYADLDASAIAAQRAYKRRCLLRLLVIALCALLGVLPLLPVTQVIGDAIELAQPLLGARPEPSEIDVWLLRLAIVALSCGMILTVVTFWWLDTKRPYHAWNDARVAAELKRAALINVVMDADAQAHAGESAVLPLKLEYVRRFHLEIQKEFFARRGEQYEARTAGAERLRRIGQWIVLAWLLVAFLVAVAVPYSEQYPLDARLQGPLAAIQRYAERPHLDVVLLVIALALCLVYGVALAKTYLDEAWRNAARFKGAEEELGELQDRELEDARRAAVAAGQEQLAIAFVDRLQRLLTSEQRDWQRFQGYRKAKASRRDRRWWFGRTSARAADAEAAVASPADAPQR